MSALLGRLRRPKLSVIVVVYDMAREAPRTLRSLASPYQTGVAPEDYEIIVVDNGSPKPLAHAPVGDGRVRVRYHYIDKPSPCPAAAVNTGVALSGGEIVGIFIDGARIATPGLLSQALAGFRMYPDAVVATLGWHLGPDVQQKSTLKGYNQQVEDGLLDGIQWPGDGYRLFEISSFAASSRNGYFVTPAESNGVFMQRRSYDSIGGFDEGFVTPGGGLVNLDFFRRAVERDGAPLVMLLGEGTFHQYHGGATTNAQTIAIDRFQKDSEEYQRLRGRRWTEIDKEAIFLGRLPVPAQESLCVSADLLRQRRPKGTG